MRIGILGGGSLGMMFAARLLLVGYDPVLIVRSREQRNLIREKGVVYVEGEHVQVVFPTVRTIDEEIAPMDFLFLTVKQTHILSILHFLQKIGESNTFLIPLQNGLGHLEKLHTVYPTSQIFVGVTTEGAKRFGPNQVERTGVGCTWIGLNKEDVYKSSRSAELMTLFQNAGIRLAWDSDILLRSWRKLLINAVINPITGVLGIRNGELLQSDSLVLMMKTLLKESLEVAHAMGFEISFEIWQEIEEVCRNTSKNHSSMLQDIMAGRPTEIEYINGYIIQQGKKRNISTQTHEIIVQLFRGKEEVNLGSDSK